MRSPRSPARVLIGRYCIALAAALVVVVGSIISANVFIDSKLDSIKRVQLDVAPDTGPAEPANFLLIGSDSRAFVTDPAAGEAFGDPNAVTGQRSDTLMVIRVEPEQERAFVVSFPRDLLVDVPGLGPTKINAAFSQSRQTVVDTLKANFDIDIQHYLQIDFESFRGIVDSLGGVRIYFAEPVTDPCSTFDLEPPRFTAPGYYELNGDDALLYVRSRHYYRLIAGEWEQDPLADLDRIERQQDFMRRVAAQAVESSIANPITGIEVSAEAISRLRIDDDLSRSDVNKLINAFRNVNPEDPSTLEMTTIPWAQDPRGNLVVDDFAAAPVLAALRGQAPLPAPPVPPPAPTAAPGATVPAAPAATPPVVVPTPPGPSVCRS